jgi:glycosyltransferase involved in cell wall biosynthesis
MRTAVDIVLPCYNPNESWYKELLAFYAQAGDRYDLNFILVNDGSGPNRLEEQLARLRDEGISIRYIAYEKNRGKGYALRQGIGAAGHAFVVYTDVDFPFTDQSTLEVIDTLTKGDCDIVAGYRDEKYYQKTMSAYRKLLSRAFRFFIRRILNMSVTDTQCGLKGFNQKGRAKFLTTTINRYLFDFEFIYTSGKDKGLVIKTVQVQLKDNIVFSKMKLKILVQEVFNLLRVLIFRKRQ